MNGDLFRMVQGEEEIKPYILGDKGYLLLPWLMVLLKQFDNVCHIVLETLHNKHSCQGRNSFGMLKKVSYNPSKNKLGCTLLI